jgi:hypothetical protein
MKEGQVCVLTKCKFVEWKKFSPPSPLPLSVSQSVRNIEPFGQNLNLLAFSQFSAEEHTVCKRFVICDFRRSKIHEAGSTEEKWRQIL